MEGKVSAIRNFNRPITKYDMRSFLGMCEYYQKFIKQFSTMATPLTELTRKSMPNKVKWDSKCEKATSMLKSLLTQAPILSTPDWTKPFILQTDASAFGLGYVLSHINDLGGGTPYSICIKKFSPPKQNYSAIERKKPWQL